MSVFFRRRTAGASAAILGLSLLTAACGGTAPTPGGATTGGDSATGGSGQPAVNRVVFTVGTPLRTDLDLRQLAEPYVFPMRPVYDNLIAVDAKTGKFLPGLATEWKVEPDGQSFRVKLRDAQFHNGMGPARAEDIKFGWEQIKLPDSNHGQRPYFLNNIKDIEIVSDRELVFQMNRPDGIFFNAISDFQGGAEVRSKADFDKNGAPTWVRKSPLAGTGPYKFKEGAEGQFLRLEDAKNNHWTGKPDFPEFEWRFAKEASTRMAQLLTGEAHLADLPQDLAQQAEKQGMKTYRGEFPGTRVWAGFRCCFIKDVNNLDGGYMYPESPLMDKRVRQALSKAINRDEMNKAFFGGKGETMYLNHFHPTRLGYSKDWETKFKDAYGYDVAAARKLLADAGQSNLKFTILVTGLPGVSGGEDMSEAVANYWRAIGVQTTLETVEGAQLTPKSRAFDYSNHVKVEASGSNQWSGSTIWGSSVTHLGNGFESAKMDAILRQIATTVDLDRQAALWKQAGDVAFDDFMNVPLFWLPAEAVGNPKVVASWTYPGGITGAWTHAVNIKAVR